MLAASFPQEVSGRVRFEKVVSRMFTHGMDTKKAISALEAAILNDPESRALMECILQI